MRKGVGRDWSIVAHTLLIAVMRLLAEIDIIGVILFSVFFGISIYTFTKGVFVKGVAYLLFTGAMFNPYKILTVSQTNTLAIIIAIVAIIISLLEFISVYLKFDGKYNLRGVIYRSNFNLNNWFGDVIRRVDYKKSEIMNINNRYGTVHLMLKDLDKSKSKDKYILNINNFYGRVVIYLPTTMTVHKNIKHSGEYVDKTSMTNGFGSSAPLIVEGSNTRGEIIFVRMNNFDKERILKFNNEYRYLNKMF